MLITKRLRNHPSWRAYLPISQRIVISVYRLDIIPNISSLLLPRKKICYSSWRQSDHSGFEDSRGSFESF